MKRRVFISKLASLNQADNVNYVLENFGYNAVLNYLDKYESILSDLEKGFVTNMYIEDRGAYRVLVVRQIYIIYKVLNGKYILILDVWNNVKNPYWF